LRDAVREAPDRAEYLTALARVLLSNPQYERGPTLNVVRPLLEHALTLAPDDAETKNLLSSIADPTG
jgi:cytochrome c-type biogenesis protein CcmH/NrfG